MFSFPSCSQWASCRLGWFWPLSSWSSTAHCHPVRGPCSVSVAMRKPDRRCPVSAAGPKSSLPPWIFHLWILQNQCSVFAFPDRDHGSAFFFTTPYHFVFLCVYLSLCVCVYVFLIFPNLSPTLSALRKPHPLSPLLYPSPLPLPSLHFSLYKWYQ